MIETASKKVTSFFIEKGIIERYPMKHSEVHEDYYTWLCILREGIVAYGINEALVYYRRHKSGKSNNKLKSLVMTFGVYRLLGYKKVRAFQMTLTYGLHALKKHYVQI